LRSVDDTSGIAFLTRLADETAAFAGHRACSRRLGIKYTEHTGEAEVIICRRVRIAILALATGAS